MTDLRREPPWPRRTPLWIRSSSAHLTKILGNVFPDHASYNWTDAAGCSWTPQAFAKKFGVDPESIPDFLALVGDSADGFPGIPRWGAKSTALVLAEYLHLDKIPPLARELAHQRTRWGNPGNKPAGTPDRCSVVSEVGHLAARCSGQQHRRGPGMGRANSTVCQSQ